MLGGKLGIGKYAIVDDDFYEKYANKKWYVNKDGYAWYTFHKPGCGGVCKKCEKVLMHRLALNPLCHKMVDHINGKRLDNRRSNLRECDASENQFNRRIGANNNSGHKGVAWHKSTRKWQAYIQSRGKWEGLGLYKLKQDAIKARREREAFLFGVYGGLS